MMPPRDLQEPDITPEGSSAFERVARRLGLSPSQYASSEALKEWVRQNKNEKFVPPDLLTLWGFEVDGEIGAEPKKPPQGVA